MERVTDGKKLISSGKATMEVRLTKNIDGKRSGLEKCESLACRKALAASDEEKSVRNVRDMNRWQRAAPSIYCYLKINVKSLG